MSQANLQNYGRKVCPDCNGRGFWCFDTGGSQGGGGPDIPCGCDGGYVPIVEENKPENTNS
jgi:hypothetical protein